MNCSGGCLTLLVLRNLEMGSTYFALTGTKMLLATIICLIEFYQQWKCHPRRPSNQPTEMDNSRAYIEWLIRYGTEYAMTCSWNDDSVMLIFCCVFVVGATTIAKEDVADDEVAMTRKPNPPLDTLPQIFRLQKRDPLTMKLTAAFSLLFAASASAFTVGDVSNRPASSALQMSTAPMASAFQKPERVIREEVPTVYVYDHCPFCVRVRVALGIKNIKHNLHFMANDDIPTPTKLVGKKIAPIFVRNPLI